MTSSLRVRVLRAFDDPALGAEAWNALLGSGNTDTLFLSWHWQRAWWDSFGRGDLLLTLVERAGRAVALAPLFVDGGMIFFVGSGGSDYLDFIGDIGRPEVLDAILETARGQIPDFVGFRFCHVPEASLTGPRLQAAAVRLGLQCHKKGGPPAPALDLGADPQAGQVAVRKRSLMRHERFFHREGALEIHHFRDGTAILPQLPAFFEQHVRRWEATPHPSLFNDGAQRAFYTRLTRTAADVGWLRFTRVDWNQCPIAFHYGFCYRGTYLWYKPSFATEFARRSPGEVLLRHLLLAAMDEGASRFDFGLGDEPFKRRFATRLEYVGTWGLYRSATADQPRGQRATGAA
jgi:CelD/BcsL family acetyltransferase involved in cellulose biosynthesis